MSEEVLDAASRADILSKVFGKSKAPVREAISSTTPGTGTHTVVNEGGYQHKPHAKPVCKNCGHTIWCDGTAAEWQHCGKDHHANCACRQAELEDGVVESNHVATISNGPIKFDSTTPAAVLLEAVIGNKINEAKQDEAEQKLNDAARKKLIEKIEGVGDNFMKSWRF